LKIKSPRLQENPMGAKVFGTQFISILFQAGMSMWNIFDQLEMYLKNGDDREPMRMVHGAAGRFGIEHAPF